ncbi:XRE family transcriptional regulator [Roseibium sp. TrichSKD4]|uniref:helix-turn-helix domain-containing protein n=1 Tax=Roseibium sp. TrichSKD4 TaxID=744980 RepID=UPI0001E56233|nr:XRE family transcriptional regulator [Roseibium sp. TrichSKD4]
MSDQDRRIDARTLKAARALLGWSAADLSNASGVPQDTIRSFESGRTKSFTTLNGEALVSTLAKEGVSFICEFDKATGPGVCYNRLSTRWQTPSNTTD